jgi:DNA polymerase-4
MYTKDESGARYFDKIGLPATNDTPTLIFQFQKLWQNRPSGGAPVKKVDVSVFGLEPASQIPKSLFEDLEKQQRVSQAMDQINERWGTLAIYSGALHNCRQIMENKIAFGRIPESVD